MKKIKILLVVLCLVTSIKLVKAEEYRTYSQGTEVEVILNNDNLKETFYVLTDNGKNSDTITLFMKGYAGVSKFYDTLSEDNPCNYETSDLKKNVESKTATWTNAIERRLITYDELKSISGVYIPGSWSSIYYIKPNSIASCQTSEKGSSKIGVCYWTMSSENENNVYVVVASGFATVDEYQDHGYIRSDFCTNFGSANARAVIDELLSESGEYQGLYIRPVIKIKKEYIVGYSDPDNNDGNNPSTGNQPNPSPNPSTPNNSQNTDNDASTNPKTGVTYIIIVALLLIVALVGVIYFYNKRKQEKQ